jgi:hypothetical protein
MASERSSSRDPLPPQDWTLDEVVSSPHPPAELSPPAEYRPRVDSDGLITSQGPVFKDDFVLEVPEEADTSEYEHLLPPEGISPAQRRAMVAPPIPLTEEEEPVRPLWQFSMTEMLWLTTFLAIGFAVMYYLPPDRVAGVLGLLALVGQALVMRFPPEQRHIRIAAAVLLILYVCAAAVAFVMHLLS